YYVTVQSSNSKITNLASLLSGVSTVPVKKSHIGIRLKNSIVSDNSVKTIPIVINMDVDAMINKRIGINFSIFSDTFLTLLLFVIMFFISTFVTLLFVFMFSDFLSCKSTKVDGRLYRPSPVYTNVFVFYFNDSKKSRFSSISSSGKGAK